MVFTCARRDFALPLAGAELFGGAGCFAFASLAAAETHQRNELRWDCLVPGEKGV